VLNHADECLQRADECRDSAAQSADDVLRVTYLDLSRRWRMLAREAGTEGHRIDETIIPHSRTGIAIS
jgi:hypothetical protein